MEGLYRFPRAGRLEWIGLSSRRREPLEVVQEAQAEAGRGLAGDRHAKRGRPSKREVTVVCLEELELVGRLIGRVVEPGEVRRNLVVSGLNLLALNKCRFQIGEVLLEGTGPCDPCSRMEEALGPGGLTAMRGHGGLCARVLQGGRVAVGDEVLFVSPPPKRDI
jgi:MOSC domain-containing protein YiiM